MDDEKDPECTPGPYYARAIPLSRDIAIYSDTTGEWIVQALSRASGHDDAPHDAAALQNANLLTYAPRMRDILRSALSHRESPLHPNNSGATREVLARIASVDHQELLRERDALSWQEKRAGKTGRRASEKMNDYFNSEEWLRFKGGVDEKQLRAPIHTPGPYVLQGMGDSHDIAVFSGVDYDRVARVLSRDSGLPTAPEDKVALCNASLFRVAPQMRETLELVLEREQQPMHPVIAKAIHDLLREIEVGAGEQIILEREEFREDDARRKELEASDEQDEGHSLSF